MRGAVGQRAVVLRGVVLGAALVGLFGGAARADDPLKEFKRAWAAAAGAADDEARATAQVQALGALAQDDSLPCAEALLKLSLDETLDYRVRDEAEARLHALKGPEVALWASKALEGGEHDPARRVALCAFIAARAETDVEAGMLLLPALSDKQPKVQLAAIRGLRHVQRKVVLQALIRALPTAADGRVKGDIVDALRQLTGEKLASSEEWTAWWGARGEAFEFGAAPSGAPKPAGDDDEEADDPGRFETVTRLPPPASKGETVYSEIKSSKVVFVVDVSSSMQVKCQDSNGDSRTRMDYVKHELVAVLESQLEEDDTFALIAFSHEVAPFQRKMLKATKANLKKAVAWAKGRLKPDGETDIYGALELAFQLKDVDTIYFLTDGTQSVDLVTKTPDYILGQVRKWNAGRGVRICTIGFLAGDGSAYGVVQDKGMAKRFLQRLAKQNDGTSRFFE